MPLNYEQIFGDDFIPILQAIEKGLPDQVETMLLGQIDKMMFEVSIFSDNITKTVASLSSSGVSSAQIQNIIGNDMATGGKIFGSFRNSVKEEIVNGMNQASRLGQFEEYGPRDRYAWITVGGHKICADCDSNEGAVKSHDKWVSEGLPGSGWSLCGGYCYCVLDPIGKIDSKVQAPKEIKPEKAATVRPKVSPPISKPKASKPKTSAPTHTTFTDYEKGNIDIHDYFLSEEISNPRNIQILEEYSSGDFWKFNKFKKYLNDKAGFLADDMYNEITDFYPTSNGVGKLFSLKKKDYDGWKSVFNEFKNFLNKAPNYQGVSYRGMGLNLEDMDHLWSRFQTGNIVEANRFWSSSASDKAARLFIDKKSACFVTVKINGKTGTILNKMVKYQGEKEILFSSGTKFKVTKAKKVQDDYGGAWRIYLEIDEI